MTQITEHFTLSEVTFSETATRLGIDNSLPPKLMPNVQATAQMMELIRQHLGGVPVRVSSWYRCVSLNRRLGSSDSSDHTLGFAVDFRADGFGPPLRVAHALAASVDSLGIGQLIAEFASSGGGWVHVSAKRPKVGANRILTIDQRGVMLGIVA